jgi:hypothetical protein
MGRSARRRTRATEQRQELEELAAQGSSPSLSERTQNPIDRSDPMEELVERLSNLNTRSKFKAPKYTGDTDIELFITQFLDVADANNWRPRETTLHLRHSLEGKAAECGQGSDVEEILHDLRSRFGMTAKQARSKLVSIQKKAKQTYHELGSEITKLVRLAYPQQGRMFQTETALEIFAKAVNHKGLQHHLLARPHESIAQAVEICNEFAQIEAGRTSVSNVYTVEEGTENKEPTKSKEQTETQAMLSAMFDLIKNQTQVMSELVKQKTEPKKLECFICKGPHLRRNCPLKPTPSSTTSSGNEKSPAQ